MDPRHTDPGRARAAEDGDLARDSRARTGRPRLLIVDDDSTVRAFVERALREARYATTTAADGAEALHVFARLGPFDLVIMDLRMPHIGGTELARRLRQSDPHLHVLYLTGHRDDLFDQKFPLSENEAVLEKPCTVAKLRDAVGLLLAEPGNKSGRDAQDPSAVDDVVPHSRR